MTPVTYDLSVVENRPPNVAVQFRERVEASANREAYRYPVGETWASPRGSRSSCDSER